MFWPFVRRKSYVVFGGKQFIVSPLDLEAAAKLLWLLMPYMPFLETHLPRLQAAFQGRESRVLSSLMFVLRDELRESPGDMIKVIALLSGTDPEWLARSATPQELIDALPVLDKVHNLGRLAQSVYQTGLTFNVSA